MFIVLNMMITFYYYYFQETYNNRCRERYGDDILTHPEFDPDLWMEVGSLGRPDKNRVYGLSNTTADNLRSTRSVSTVGSSQSISSSQSKNFVILQQHTLNSPRNTITYQRSMHNSKRLMHNKKRNKERSLSKSKHLKHNKKRLMNNKKRLMNSFAK